MRNSQSETQSFIFQQHHHKLKHFEERNRDSDSYTGGETSI